MLKVVHISTQSEIVPKKLTVKQRKDQEIRMMIDEQYRKDYKAAMKRIDQIRELIK